MSAVFSIMLAYLLGSIPPAYLVAHARGIDIRKVGDANVGAANVMRCLGFAPAAFTFSADVAKGALAILIARHLSGQESVVLFAGVAVVAGHNWPITLGFRGGRGAATTIGVLFALLPIHVGIMFPLAAGTLWLSRNYTLSSVVMFATVPFFAYFTGAFSYLCAYAAALPCIVGLTTLARVHALDPQLVRQSKAVGIDKRNGNVGQAGAKQP
jgi:glycerol-3-phosphate acyltransferase PlsY